MYRTVHIVNVNLLLGGELVVIDGYNSCNDLGWYNHHSLKICHCLRYQICLALSCLAYLQQSSSSGARWLVQGDSVYLLGWRKSINIVIISRDACRGRYKNCVLFVSTQITSREYSCELLCPSFIRQEVKICYYFAEKFRKRILVEIETVANTCSFCLWNQQNYGLPLL